MDDRELLELAAKAAGFCIDYSATNGGGSHNTGFDIQGNAVLDWHNGTVWNPLTSDGDAMRLAVDLGLRINTCVSPEYIEDQPYAEVGALSFVNGLPRHVNVKEVRSGNPRAATRRAIVKAAAEIGKMKGEKES